MANLHYFCNIYHTSKPWRVFSALKKMCFLGQLAGDSQVYQERYLHGKGPVERGQDVSKCANVESWAWEFLWARGTWQCHPQPRNAFFPLERRFWISQTSKTQAISWVSCNISWRQFLFIRPQCLVGPWFVGLWYDQLTMTEQLRRRCLFN